MEKVVFNNQRGYQLVGVIERPTKSHNGHYVLCVHGFTGDKDEKGLFAEAAKYFCEEGFSVFRFDMTGSGESGGDFQNVSIKDQENDFLAAIQFLKNKEEITNADIFILGFSLGATIVLRKYNSISDVRGLSLWSPALFPERDMYPRYQSPELREELESKGYFVKSGLKVGQKIVCDLGRVNLSPLFGTLSTPVFFAHGQKDYKISPRSTEIAYNMSNGAAWDFMVVKDADHSFRSPRNARPSVLKRTCEFFHSIPT